MVRSKSFPLFLLLTFSLSISLSLHAQKFDYPTVTAPTNWTNSPSLPHTVTYPDGSAVRTLLLRSNPAGFGPSFAAGFFCLSPCNSFAFSIFILYTNSGARITLPTLASPQVVWSANRARPVSENSTLQLSSNYGLTLRDADGTVVWSTSNSAQSVAGINITESGNLVLFDQKNSTIWQSFDHPTDSLVLGQSLVQGARLTANVSVSNWTQSGLYLTVVSGGLHALIDSDPPQLYFQTGFTGGNIGNRSTYVQFVNGSLAIFALFSQPSQPDMVMSLPPAGSVQYMRLESDGHLRLYEWRGEWAMVQDVLDVFPGDCAYPTVCGNYGICTNKQCACPSGSNSSYFKPINQLQMNLGCEPVTPISCQEMKDQQFLALSNVSYFNYIDSDAIAIRETDEETCRRVCLMNCTCKAALFQYGANASAGDCFLPSELFSLQTNQPDVTHYNSSVYLKVQVKPLPPNTVSYSNGKKGVGTGVIIGSILGALIFMFLVIGVIVFVRRRKGKAEQEEDYIDQIPGMLARFSFEELRVATQDFSTKLGEGGFGSVFEGNLGELRVAVKRLDGLGQGKKEFLAEVETIGSIHHINLVRLIGFCADRSHRLLVYEYMSNGSLDKWIYYRDRDVPLDWQTRYKIITDVAKGLCYLHEECRQRIAHLDIKPQNILLDDTFNAKVSDFGLSKLIDRDKSHVMTGMRGTPGYLAPEWLTAKITEKVDVYSFGVVVLEILCGRRNLDHSLPEESVHLISLLEKKIKTNEGLLDLIDKHGDDMVLHEDEVMNVMKLAMWCLQRDSNRRPSMSGVVKVLEGSMDIETRLDYNFLASKSLISRGVDYADLSEVPLVSVLSGPR